MTEMDVANTISTMLPTKCEGLSKCRFLRLTFQLTFPVVETATIFRLSYWSACTPPNSALLKVQSGCWVRTSHASIP